MPRRGADLGVLADVESAISTVPRPGLVEFGWHWRYELLIVGLLAGPLAAIGVLAGTGWLIAVAFAEGILCAAPVAIRPVRRRLIAWVWCVVTPHRIRTGCRHAWVQSRDGRLPVVLYATPAEYGERAVLWCRAGITADDLNVARAIITAACWARDVRVLPSERGRHMVTLQVTRREPVQELASWPYLARQDEPEEPATAA
jgi:hypothetical protein